MERTTMHLLFVTLKHCSSFHMSYTGEYCEVGLFPLDSWGCRRPADAGTLLHQQNEGCVSKMKPFVSESGIVLLSLLIPAAHCLCCDATDKHLVFRSVQEKTVEY